MEVIIEGYKFHKYDKGNMIIVWKNERLIDYITTDIQKHDDLILFGYKYVKEHP